MQSFYVPHIKVLPGHEHSKPWICTDPSDSSRSMSQLSNVLFLYFADSITFILQQVSSSYKRVSRQLCKLENLKILQSTDGEQKKCAIIIKESEMATNHRSQTRYNLALFKDSVSDFALFKWVADRKEVIKARVSDGLLQLWRKFVGRMDSMKMNSRLIAISRVF